MRQWIDYRGIRIHTGIRRYTAFQIKPSLKIIRVATVSEAKEIVDNHIEKGEYTYIDQFRPSGYASITPVAVRVVGGKEIGRGSAPEIRIESKGYGIDASIGLPDYSPLVEKKEKGMMGSSPLILVAIFIGVLGYILFGNIRKG